MSDEPRLRGRSKTRFSPWPIGQVPERVIKAIGKQLVYCLAMGMEDVTGDGFGDIFADAIGGKHYSSPLGLVDVDLDNTAWSVKTVKATDPHKAESVRIISGRNSPNFSFGIRNPLYNLKATGRAVLSIWNERLNMARDKYDDVRVLVLARNMDSKKFVLFEEEITRYVFDDYTWRKNKRGNLQGHRKTDAWHLFTWQPHGSQFTIKRDIPGSAIRFRIDRKVPLVEPIQLERLINYSDDWIKIG